MKKTICALGTAALLFGLLTTAMAEKEALYFSEDSHSLIVTSEVIGRSEYGETAFDIRVTMTAMKSRPSTSRLKMSTRGSGKRFSAMRTWTAMRIWR